MASLLVWHHQLVTVTLRGVWYCIQICCSVFFINYKIYLSIKSLRIHAICLLKDSDIGYEYKGKSINFWQVTNKVKSQLKKRAELILKENVEL
jgi:hypothetical protein